MAEKQASSEPSPSSLILPLSLLSALSGYGLYLSYQNITRLRQYEEQSEKAAKWSNTAAQRLHKTRTTQASGTITLLVSLITCLALLFTNLGGTNGRVLVSAGLLNAVALLASHTHMERFWNDRNQTQVPFVEKFNEAIKGSELVVKILGILCFAWFDAGFLWFLGWDNTLLQNAAFAGSVALWSMPPFGFVSQDAVRLVIALGMLYMVLG